MPTLIFSTNAQNALNYGQAIATTERHQVVDTPHLLLALVLYTSDGQAWVKKSNSTDQATFVEKLKNAMQKWYVAGSEQADPSQNYIRAMRHAQERATNSGSHHIEPAHLLNAVLESDDMLADWLMSVGIQSMLIAVPAQTPVLDEMGRDITRLAKSGKIQPIIGREAEVSQVIEVLMRHGKNSVLLLGLPGVGKTAVVEKLAQMIAESNVPTKLTETRLIELSMSALVAGTTYRGEFEERLRRILDEIERVGNIILIIDEFHTLAGAGTTRDSALDAANILKPALARGELTCIGITTLDEYTRYIEPDQALVRRFHPIIVAEPSPEATLEILVQLSPSYESHHKITVHSEALEATVRLAAQYLPSRQFPDKAIDILGKACSRAEIQQLAVVTTEIIATVVSETAGIPIGQLTNDTRQMLSEMEEALSGAVIGQEEAVRTVARAIRIAYTGLRDPDRPKAIFLFSGPSGVGKTQLARTLAGYLFADEKAFVRLDMSEYAEKHTVSRLIGAPPGYVGYDEPGQLTQPLRDRPHSIVLLDEIEKAHPEIFDVFLQLFGEGRLTDAKGRLVDGRHAIFVMTTNLGAQTMKRAVGFSSKYTPPVGSTDEIDEAIRSFFRPEFLNRIDHVIRFRSLDLDDLTEIAQLELQHLKARLKEQRVRLSYASAVAEIVAHAAQLRGVGARGIARVVEEMIAMPISERLLEANKSDRNWLHLEADGQQIRMEWV
ncbi:MAG: ATP-dependent Clp protease ATP-binding subunit [Candidatus Melainabacteria bacterium]|nr:ATP-dependent Clp protease ATP-binding subunit [Candidatus Melainabacteria bacterium]